MIDLKKTFGDRFKISLDESTEADPTRSERLWQYRIPCKYGFVSVHSPGLLAAFTGRRLMIARLAATPGVRTIQRGDGEIRVVFKPDRLDVVAKLLQARRLPVLSECERATRAERMRSLVKNAASGATRRG